MVQRCSYSGSTPSELVLPLTGFDLSSVWPVSSHPTRRVALSPTRAPDRLAVSKRVSVPLVCDANDYSIPSLVFQSLYAVFVV